MFDETMHFDTIEELALSAFDAVRPPARLGVMDTAEKYRVLRDSPVHAGKYTRTIAPYMCEPSEAALSRSYRGVVFIGPSQCSKTDTFLNLLLHAIVSDPGPMLLVHMTEHMANDFSKTKIDPFHRHTIAAGEKLIPGIANNGLKYKRYRSGTQLSIGWPTVNSLSSRSFRRVFLTDFDRFPLDVEGEGNPYDLAAARITTFGRQGSVFVESTPGYDLEDPEWSPEFPHQGPPVPGIVSLYNRGDCRRYMWQCVDCRMWFEPDWPLMKYPKDVDPITAGEQCYLACPHCGSVYTEAAGARPSKHAMNLAGRWVASGQTLDRNGSATGQPRRSDIASFWIKGPAAAMRTWSDMVTDMLAAEIEWERSHDEGSLRTKTNTVIGVPYMPKSMAEDRSPSFYRSRAYDFGRKVVPAGGRFLVASVDVQKNRFEVQVHAIGAGCDIWIVDRFAIRDSERDDAHRPDVKAGLEPFIYSIDWRRLLSEVLALEYPLADGSGRMMALRAVVCDSVGRDRTTTNAYEFFRWLRRGPSEEEIEAGRYEAWRYEHAMSFWLYHGRVTRNAPRTEISYPDSKQSGSRAGARGEIPVLRAHSDLIKDQLFTILGREVRGSGMVHFPDWLPPEWYRELCVERRDNKGHWENPGYRRNESWDLLCMCLALCIEKNTIDYERIDWSYPPEWAMDWTKEDADHALVYDPKTAPDLPTSRERAETRTEGAREEGGDTEEISSIQQLGRRLGHG